MAAPRKVFRIEELAAPQRLAQVDDAPAPDLAEIMRELGSLRAMLIDPSPRQPSGSRALPRNEVDRLAAKLQLIRSAITGAAPEQAGSNGSRSPEVPATRIANELEAVMRGGEQATQKILAAAEEIDQAANNLSAALKDNSEQGLAQDIRDRVIAIFEACNFQDLTSQRVAKVLASFAGLDRQIARALDALARVDAAPPLNGPRLGDDVGHVSQSDIDSLFERGIQSEQ